MARLLLIDDDDALRDVVAAVFTRRGHEVRTAADGRAGIDALRDFPADLVITDINMPEMDGIEVIVGLQEIRPDLPIVAISGGGLIDKDSLLDDAGDLGAVSTLPKPFELSELIATIESALEGD